MPEPTTEGGDRPHDPSTRDAEGVPGATEPAGTGADFLVTRPPGESTAEARLEITDGPTHPGSADGAVGRVRYFGDYILGDVLGRGGMGVVFAARQVSLNRPVAIKMLRDGALADGRDLRRFQNEAEAVARLDHPHIVPVYEIGEHGGRRYFSMKLIAGGSLDGQLARYVAEPEASARLMVDVADAVHHAHQRGLLHRDLKPANILVDDLGGPHVTDFGLVRLVEGGEELTQSGAILGTPAYMAPEQAGGRRGAVTTSSDVYGLGGVLFALLTGRAPFVGNGVMATLEQVRERPPDPPRKLNRSAPRDLEVICLKCLEKDPRRRYDSAAALADDLRRWLDRRPIEARPVGILERARLWARRRPALAGLTAALAVAVVAGFVGVAWQWRRAERQRRVAERINHFLNDEVLAQASPDRNPRAAKVTVEDMLDLASARLDSAFPDDPEVEAAIRRTIGQAYASLGRFDRADVQQTRAVDLSRRARGSVAPETLITINEQVAARLDSGSLDGLEDLIRKNLADCRRFLGVDHVATLTASGQLANLFASLDRTEEAELLLRASLAEREHALGPRHTLTLEALNNLAMNLTTQGKFDEAEPLSRRYLELVREVKGADDPATLTSVNNLALLLLNSRRAPVEAEETLRRNSVEARRIFGDHHITYTAANNHARALNVLNRLDEAEAIFRRTLDARVRLIGFDSEAANITRSDLALLLLGRGKYDEAEPFVVDGLDVVRRLPAPPVKVISVALHNKAWLLGARGKFAEAEPLIRESMALIVRRYGPDCPDARTINSSLAAVLEAQGKLEAAEPIRRALLRVNSERPAADPDRILAAADLGRVLADLGRADEAEPILRGALDAMLKLVPPDHWRVLDTRSALGGCLIRLARLDEAEPHLNAAFPALARARGIPLDRPRRAVDRLIALDLARGRPDRVARWRLLRLDLGFPADPFAR